MYLVCAAHAFEALASSRGGSASSYTETKHWWISFVRTTSRAVMWSDFVYTSLFWGNNIKSLLGHS